MRLWRISNYANLLGMRGLECDARWHTAGSRIVYLASSPAGSLLEVLVHLELDEEEGELPIHYQLLESFAPETLTVEELNPPDDREKWILNESITRGLGDEWLRSRRSALARVPSAILPSTWNYLLNPAHPDAPSISIVSSTSARFDARLFRKMRD